MNLNIKNNKKIKVFWFMNLKNCIIFNFKADQNRKNKKIP